MIIRKQTSKAKKIILLLLFSFLSIKVSSSAATLEKNNANFSFIVAGHTYGSHKDTNLGLYPKFVDFLKKNKPENIEFMVLTGDIVRQSTPSSWEKVTHDVESVGIRSYFVMGNHDYSDYGKRFFKEKYGDTFYRFDHGNASFICLNPEEKVGYIPNAQIEIIKEALKDPGNNYLFLFTNELLWAAGNPKYKKVRHNFGYYPFYSNFWNDIFPLFKDFPNKEIYYIAGDVGGNPNVIPAFYEKLGNVTLLASGMGEVQDENFLIVTISEKEVELKLVPLNENNSLLEIQEYNLESINK